jgi:hypothetical protein
MVHKPQSQGIENPYYHEHYVTNPRIFLGSKDSSDQSIDSGIDYSHGWSTGSVESSCNSNNEVFFVSTRSLFHRNEQHDHDTTKSIQTRDGNGSITSSTSSGSENIEIPANYHTHQRCLMSESPGSINDTALAFALENCHRDMIEDSESRYNTNLGASTLFQGYHEILSNVNIMTLDSPRLYISKTMEDSTTGLQSSMRWKMDSSWCNEFHTPSELTKADLENDAENAEEDKVEYKECTSIFSKINNFCFESVGGNSRMEQFFICLACISTTTLLIFSILFLLTTMFS